MAQHHRLGTYLNPHLHHSAVIEATQRPVGRDGIHVTGLLAHSERHIYKLSLVTRCHDPRSSSEGRGLWHTTNHRVRVSKLSSGGEISSFSTYAISAQALQ